MTPHRSEGALLAGVCAGMARMFGWNVWALRALFVIFLLVKTLWALVAYAVLALAFQLRPDVSRKGDGDGDGLGSPELSERSRRIADLEKRFRDLEGR